MSKYALLSFDVEGNVCTAFSLVARAKRQTTIYRKRNYQTATGLSTLNDQITQIGLAVRILHSDMSMTELKPFVELVRCNRAISEKAEEVTGISNNMLVDCRPFSKVIQAMGKHLDSVLDASVPRVLIAYNGNRFDLPILASELCRHFGEGYEMEMRKLKIAYVMDAFVMCKRLLPEHQVPRTSSGRLTYKLGDIYKCVTMRELVGAHDALADSNAVLEILQACTPMCETILQELEPECSAREFLQNPVIVMKPLYQKYQAAQKTTKAASGSVSILRVLKNRGGKRPREEGASGDVPSKKHCP